MRLYLFLDRGQFDIPSSGYAFDEGELCYRVADVVSHLPSVLVALVVFGVVTKFLGPSRSVDAETRCRKCGYILRGIPEPRCSECGEQI